MRIPTTITAALALLTATAQGRYHDLSLAPWNLDDAKGNRTVAQVMPAGSDTVTFQAAWLYLSRYKKFSYAQWRAMTYPTACFTDAAWRGEGAANIAAGRLNTYNYMRIPSGRYEVSTTCIVPRGGMNGSSSFWSPGNGQGHGFYSTEIVMRDDLWLPAGPGAERRMFDGPNSDGSAGNFSYNESMTIEKLYLRGPDKRDGIVRIGLFFSWMGECTYVNQVRGDYWTHAFVARGGVPLSIGTMSAFWNHEGGLSLLGCSQATFSVQTLSGDGNKRLLNIAPGYNTPSGAIINVGLLKNEDGTTPGAPLGNQVAVYAEGQYVVNIGIATLACQSGSAPEAMFLLRPTLPNFGNQNSSLNVGGVYAFGFGTVIKNLVTGATWTAPQYAGYAFTHYANGDKVWTGADYLTKNGGTGGGTTPPPTDPPPTAGGAYPRAAWVATAYRSASGVEGPVEAINTNFGRHWTNGEVTRADGTQWYQLDMGVSQKVGRITLTTRSDRTTDYPATLRVQTSTNGTTWTSAATVAGSANMTVTLPAAPTVRYIRMAPVAARGHWWSIDELNVFP